MFLPKCLEQFLAFSISVTREDHDPLLSVEIVYSQLHKNNWSVWFFRNINDFISFALRTQWRSRSNKEIRDLLCPLLPVAKLSRPNKKWNKVQKLGAAAFLLILWRIVRCEIYIIIQYSLLGSNYHKISVIESLQGLPACSRTFAISCGESINGITLNTFQQDGL